MPSGSRPAAHQHIEIGRDKDGKLLAVRQSALSQTSINDNFVRAVGEVTEVLYDFPALETRHALFRTHTGAPTNMRAPAESYGSFALETGLDPVQMSISDNGKGIEQVPESGSGMGLKGIRHRANSLDGTFHIGNAEQSGTRLEVLIPLVRGA